MSPYLTLELRPELHADVRLRVLRNLQAGVPGQSTAFCPKARSVSARIEA